jgi:hypothetical protein
MERQLTARRDTSVHCVAWDRAVPRKMRGQKYCSRRCRNRKNNQERIRKALWGGDTRGEATPTKFINENNGMPIRKLGPSPGVSALPAVIHAELFAGRKWERITSEDGVTCLISRKSAARTPANEAA